MEKIKNLLVAAMLTFAFSTSIMQINAQHTKYVDDFGLKPFIHIQRGACSPNGNNSHAAFRTYDGTFNNTNNGRTEYGAADIALYRELPAEYSISDPNNAMNGMGRPSPREISNVLCDEPVTQFNSRNVSAFFYVWGQFVDHDISLTPTGSTEFAPVNIPAGDPVFTVPIPFFRSEVRAGTGITSPRQQSNLNTAWLDASVVYGSDSVRAKWLRTFVDGKLKTSSGNMLPWNTISGEKNDPIDPNAPSMADDGNHTVKTVVAGDVRASEHPGISALHTVFVREHNRICNRLKSQGYTNDELIFQKARKEVGAIIQAITFNEFLPAIGITLSPYCGYKSNVRPDLANTFATAGYRLGHTMVADEVALRDNDCVPVPPDALDLVDIFFNTTLLDDFGLEPFLRGFATHKQYETDNKINSVLRNFLFGPGSGLDLASLNIQRGRDHGLPDYNKVRKYYTGTGVTDFNQITSDTAKQTALRNLYGHVNNIDLWVGILAEDRLPNKSVGKTIYFMLRSQFEKIRDGDYYYYQNDPFLPWNIKNQVKYTRLSDVIKRNTLLTNLQSNVFFIRPCPGENGEDRQTLETTETPAFRIFPNPVIDGIVTIEISDPVTACTFRLISPTGSVVQSLTTFPGENITQFDTKNLAPGVYFILGITGKKQASVKFIKLNN